MKAAVFLVALTGISIFLIATNPSEAEFREHLTQQRQERLRPRNDGLDALRGCMAMSEAGAHQQRRREVNVRAIPIGIAPYSISGGSRVDVSRSNFLFFSTYTYEIDSISLKSSQSFIGIAGIFY